MLKPGTYKLSRDVNNPRPDRRSTRDTRCKKVWPAGTEMLAVEYRRHSVEDLEMLSPDQRERIEARSRYIVLQFVGDDYPTLHEIGPGDELRYNALIAALEPVAESRAALFTRLGVSGTGFFARWLVDSGRISQQLFEQLWHEYEASGDELEGVPVKQYPPLVELTAERAAEDMGATIVKIEREGA